MNIKAVKKMRMFAVCMLGPLFCCAMPVSAAADPAQTRFVVRVAGMDGRTYDYAEYIVPFDGGFGEPQLLEREESKDDTKMYTLLERRREKNTESREAARLDALAKALTARNAAAVQKIVSAVDKFTDEYAVPDDRYDVNSSNDRSVLTFVSPVSLRTNRQLTFAATQADRHPYLIDLKTLEAVELPVQISGAAQHVNFRFRWSPDGRYLAYKIRRDTIGIFDLQRKQMAKEVRCVGQIDDMVWNEAGDALAATVLVSAPSFRKVTDIIRTAKSRESESRHVVLKVVDLAGGDNRELTLARYVRGARTSVEWVTKPVVVARPPAE